MIDAPTRVLAPRSRAWLWPVGCALALVAPIVCVAMPPMVDFPAHEAVVGVLRHWGDSSYFPGDLYIHNWGHPNQLQYILAWPLAYVVETTKALEIVVALAVASVVLGAAKLAGHLGRPLWTALLVAPVAIGWNLHWGHIANLLGLGVFLWLLPEFDEFARAPRWARVPIVFGYFVLLYGAHEGMLAVAVVTVALFALAYGGSFLSFVLRACPCVAITACAFVQLALQHLTLVNEAPVRDFTITRTRMIPATIVGFYDFVVGPRVFAFIAAVVVLNGARVFLKGRPTTRSEGTPVAPAPRWRRLAQRGRFVMLGALLLVAYFVLPPAYNGVLFFFHRFLPMAWCVLVVATAPPAGTAGDEFAAPACAAVPAAMLALVLPPFIASHVAYRRLDALLPVIEKGSSVFSADLEGDALGAFNDRGFSARNAQGHVVAERGGRALADYTQSPISPALVRPDFAWQRIARDTYVRPSRFRPALVFARFRYVVLHVTSRDLSLLTRVALQNEATLVAADSEWMIFESKIIDKSALDEPERPVEFDPRDTIMKRIHDIAVEVVDDGAEPPERGH